MIIRLESAKDIEAIFDLTAAAFEPMRFSDGTEPQVINDLRTDGDLTLSLVAVDQANIVGHVAFSPVTINDVSDNWYGLGPISVLPQLQRSGIGTQLINDGYRRLKDIEAKGIALIGNPDYYGRFGFVGDGKLSHGDLPARLVQWRSISGDVPRGELQFCPAFDPKP